MPDAKPDLAAWSAASRVHDWTDGALPLRMLREAEGLDALGPAEWKLAGSPDGTREPARGESAVELAEALFAAPPGPRGTRHLRAGGTRPHPWSVSVLVPPWDAEEGYGMVNLEFPRAPFAPEARSAELADAFARTHGPDDTEWACIHPARRWTTLRADLYEVPVTIAPMFAGVFWADFLGPGHLELFDPAKLRGLEAHRVERRGDRGLLLVVSPSLADADSPATEREMERLTERFRAALKR